MVKTFFLFSSSHSLQGVPQGKEHDTRALTHAPDTHQPASPEGKVNRTKKKVKNGNKVVREKFERKVAALRSVELAVAKTSGQRRVLLSRMELEREVVEGC